MGEETVAGVNVEMCPYQQHAGITLSVIPACFKECLPGIFFSSGATNMTPLCASAPAEFRLERILLLSIGKVVGCAWL